MDVTARLFMEKLLAKIPKIAFVISNFLFSGLMRYIVISEVLKSHVF